MYAFDCQKKHAYDFVQQVSKYYKCYNEHHTVRHIQRRATYRYVLCAHKFHVDAARVVMHNIIYI